MAAAERRSSAAERRSGWRVPALIVALIAVPAAEIWLLVQVGQAIGAWWTILLLVLEAFIGAWLMRREGRKAWRALREAFARGELPGGELADAVLVLVGGILFILPGFITDVIGLICLVPVTRPIARRVLGWAVGRSAAKRGVDLTSLKTARAHLDGQVIRGETVPGETMPDAPATPDSSPDRSVIRGEIEP